MRYQLRQGPRGEAGGRSSAALDRVGRLGPERLLGLALVQLLLGEDGTGGGEGEEQELLHDEDSSNQGRPGQNQQEWA